MTSHVPYWLFMLQRFKEALTLASRSDMAEPARPQF